MLVTSGCRCARSLRLQTFEIDTDAAEKPVEEYSTLQQFFTRRLRPGLRPIAAAGCVKHAGGVPPTVGWCWAQCSMH